MATLDEAQHILRGLRRDVSQVDGGFTVRLRDQDFLVTDDEVKTYLAQKDTLRRHTETQLYMPGLYEHVVQFEGSGPRRAALRTDEGLTLRSRDDTTIIRIGRPSTLFFLGLTDVDAIDPDLRRLSLFGLTSRATGQRPISEFLRLYTINVQTDPETPLGRSRQKMHDLAEAATFHFAYGQGTAISFTRSWARTYYWIGRKTAEDVQFPLRTYNTELVAYYNLALSSDSLVLSYLALYKILEYFYTAVAEDALHRKLQEKLVDPEFLHTKKKKLRELAKIVRAFDNRIDEASSLKLVLSTYFDIAELSRWILEYEAVNGPHFTIANTVFNETVRVDLSAEASVVPNIASRIYTIRNALVHNKEGEVSRFIPYTGQEEVLLKEVQILMHIAEQLIIKTGSDM